MSIYSFIRVLFHPATHSVVYYVTQQLLSMAATCQTPLGEGHKMMLRAVLSISADSQRNMPIAVVGYKKLEDTTCVLNIHDVPDGKHVNRLQDEII